jgi:hypothetical protein
LCRYVCWFLAGASSFLFSGSVRGIGALRTEWRRTLQAQDSPTSGCDLLFVLDPTGMSFYSHNFNEVRRVLLTASQHYERILLLGNCMGATGALLVAGMFPTTCQVVAMAFNPEVPAVDQRLSGIIEHQTPETKNYPLYYIIGQSDSPL